MGGPADIKDMLRALSSLFLSHVFVPHCAACDAPWAEGLCERCAESLYELGAACPRCAEPIEGPAALLCSRCRRKPPPFTVAHAPFRYGGELGVALRRLKYQKRPEIARGLATLIAPALHQAAAHADMAMPVPLHWRRLVMRGFNQAKALLEHAGRDLAIPLDCLSLRRIRPTPPQSGSNARGRAANVAGAFAVLPRRNHRVRQKRVLLVDDVMTTGATMAACARALLDAGASEVIAFCVARAES